jgi:ribosomal protein S18 acetylase RimI-like enzyme
MDGASVRRARADDADAMGRVHVRAWRAAYGGLMPAPILDALDEARRATTWRESLEQGHGDGVCHLEGTETVALVLEEHGTIVGIASIGPSRGAPEPDTGELWMINLAPEAWGRGLGHTLLAAATDELRACGYRQAMLWVIEGNTRARRFYERAGWRADGGEQHDERGGFPLRELRYRTAL